MVFGSPKKEEEPAVASVSLCWKIKKRVSQLPSRRLSSRLPMLTFCVKDVERRGMRGGALMLTGEGTDVPHLGLCPLALSLLGSGLMLSTPLYTHMSTWQRRVYIGENRSLAYCPSFLTCYLWNLRKSLIFSDLNFFICKVVIIMLAFPVYVIR